MECVVGKIEHNARLMWVVFSHLHFIFVIFTGTIRGHLFRIKILKSGYPKSLNFFWDSEVNEGIVKKLYMCKWALKWWKCNKITAFMTKLANSFKNLNPNNIVRRLINLIKDILLYLVVVLSNLKKPGLQWCISIVYKTKQHDSCQQNFLLSLA